jgi:MutS-like protein
MPIAPADEYRARLSARRETHARLSRIDERFSYARLAVFAIAVLLGIGAWRGWMAPWWIALPVVAFLVLVVKHDAIVGRRDAAARAIAFYDRGLARIEDRWAGGGEPGERFRNPDHLYANDLDLFGPASLFELLSIARTRAGEDTLAAWLLTPAAPEEIRARQEATQDLTARLDLREALSLAGTDVRAAVHSDALVAWAEGPALLGSSWLRPAAVLLTVAAIASIALWIATANSIPVLAIVTAEIAFSWPLRERILKALHGADGAARDLDVLAVVLARLEEETFNADRLRSLQGRLTHGPRFIHRLHWFVELHDWQHNAIFAVLAAPLLWGTHLALAIEAWRRAHGRHVREWLLISGEFEALASLSAYRYEHPGDPFPDIDAAGPRHAIYDGEALGHPLIPAARMIRNDIRLGDADRLGGADLSGPRSPQLLVVSGSNMSGKSTLLRTVGINAVLAFAGAPVRARRLRIAPLRIGATLRIQDSLQEGRSRFYAEISRIRALADLAAGPVPLLFLLDELLHGTNSHDRAVGAAGILTVLLDRGAIGLITTHDLALTDVAATLGARAANVHFDDRFEAGEIVFDYVMKPGPVTRSNAIALMRAVGLDVPLDLARDRQD